MRNYSTSAYQLPPISEWLSAFGLEAGMMNMRLSEMAEINVTVRFFTRGCKYSRQRFLFVVEHSCFATQCARKIPRKKKFPTPTRITPQSPVSCFNLTAPHAA